MLRRWFPFVFSLLAVFAASGCTTVLLIDEATETVTEEYVVDGADGAWLGGNGDLTVCLYGQAPYRSSAYFAVAIPAGELAAAGGDAPLAAYRIPPDRIAARCDPPPEDTREIPSEFVGAYGGPNPRQEWYWQPAPDEEPVSDGYQVSDGEQLPDGDGEQALEEDQEPPPEADQDLDGGETQGFITATQYMERDAAGPKIYLFEEPGSDFGATVIYRHEAPLPSGVRYTRLDFPVTESRPKEALFLLLPVTVAVDVVLIAGYIYLCAQAPGAC